MSTTTAESRFDEFFDRAWRRSRTSMRTRVNRVKSKAWHIGQCAVAATIAWFIASDLVHHQAPVFAPIVAVVSLGLTYAQRLRRVAEITVGVAIGLAVADLFLA
ncbi:MAG: FUSC family protein, partial [Actinomycetota bacterium]|nr:FUSC family protein [Actinomycetota bacterium]